MARCQLSDSREEMQLIPDIEIDNQYQTIKRHIENGGYLFQRNKWYKEMARKIIERNRYTKLVTHVDSVDLQTEEEEAIEELHSLGLRYENLPPEFRRTYDDLTEDERIIKDLTMKIFENYGENHSDRQESTSGRKEAEDSTKELQQVPTTSRRNYQEVLKEIENTFQRITAESATLKRLGEELDDSFAFSAVPRAQRAKTNCNLKFLKQKTIRMIESCLDSSTVRKAHGELKRKTAGLSKCYLTKVSKLEESKNDTRTAQPKKVPLKSKVMKN